MNRVLILGGRAPVALDHARRFAHQGWWVCVADSISCRISGWSRSVSKTIRLPSPRFHAKAFVNSLIETIERNRIDLVVPTCEEVFYLSRYRHLLPRHVRIAVDDFEKLAALHSKWKFLELAGGCGATIPQSTRIGSIDEAREWSAGKPVVLKPEFSRFGVHVRIVEEFSTANSAPLEDVGPWIAQRFAEGVEHASYSVANSGELLAHSLYLPRHRLNKSASFFFEAVRNDAIENFVRSFVRKISFTGQISFDWIVGKNASITVLECNPRATSGCHLFAPSDALPAALCGTATQISRPSSASPKMLAPVMFSAGLYRAIRRNCFGAWLTDARSGEDVIARSGDLLPLCGSFADLVAYAGLAISHGGNLRAAATRDIEWDGQELQQP